MIVLNYNDRENTINFVNSILPYQIIDRIVVVDNFSSREKEIEALQTLSCEKVDVVKSEKNGGYAYGNNYGLKYLEKRYPQEFSYVIISNPDVAVSEEHIQKTVAYLKQHEKVAIAAPRMNFVTGPARRAAWKERTPWIDVASSTRITEFLLFPLFKKGEYTKKDYQKENVKVENIAGSFFVADFQKLKEVGLFDENTFLFFEEDILGNKIKEAGYEIHLLTKFSFLHYESKSIGKMMNLFRKIDLLFDSRIYYHKTYHSAGQAFVFLLEVLRRIRKIELVIEIPLTKLIQKFQKKGEDKK